MRVLKKIILSAVAFLTIAGAAGVNAAEANYQVIPLPNSIKPGNGAGFTPNSKTTIVYPKGNVKMQRNAEFLSDYLSQMNEAKLVTATSGNSNAIILQTGLKSANPEAYTLTVGKSSITIKGASEAGVFYGIQTLRKATPIGEKNVIYPAVTISDAPRFEYRGMHLDVARHFFPVSFVK